MEMARFRSWLTVVAGLLLIGCAGYRVGPTGGQSAGARSILVPPARNATLEARLSQPLTQALRRHLQQDGTLRLETESGPTDLLLESTIEDYERVAMAYQPGDVISVQEYELRMTVRIKVTERASNKTVLDRRVQGRTSLLVGDDQTSAERQAAPLLADDVARKAVLHVTEGSW
jgi:outer membrane lipopolysaccharide assembly protein LptE/RlpB